MSKVMMTIKRSPGTASLKSVTQDLGLGESDIDANFGVVAVDPDADLYAILVDEGVAGKLGHAKTVEGPFANPKIEPFGPPKS